MLFIWGWVSCSWAAKVEVPPGAREILFSDRTGTPLELLKDLDGDGFFETKVCFKEGRAFLQLKDSNKDGIPEEKLFLDKNGFPQKLLLDRNADGKPDKWQFYRQGRPYLLREDEDFDGKIELEVLFAPDSTPLIFRKDEDDDGCLEREERLQGKDRLVFLFKFTDPHKCEGRKLWSKIYYRHNLPVKRLVDKDGDGFFELEEILKAGKRCLVIKKEARKLEAFFYQGGNLWEGFEDFDGDGKLDRKYNFQKRTWETLASPLSLENLRKRCGP